MSEWTALELIVDGHVAEIRLCRPAILNRIDMVLHRELTEVFIELAARDEVRAVVFSSTGRFFSAGGDTDIMLDAASDMAKRLALLDEGRRLFRAIADFPKPLGCGATGKFIRTGDNAHLGGRRDRNCGNDRVF